jgi:hypothetical protein
MTALWVGIVRSCVKAPWINLEGDSVQQGGPGGDMQANVCQPPVPHCYCALNSSHLPQKDASERHMLYCYAWLWLYHMTAMFDC